MSPIIYLDNNASTAVDKRVLEAMLPYFSDIYANANSNHEFGIKANKAINVAREHVSDLIGSTSNEVIFTSGATEAINIAIKGVAENYGSKGKHIITVSTQHSAMLDTCKFLEQKGYEVTYLSVKNNGLIDLSELSRKIRHDTILVSVMYVNNEIGVLQPIKEIADLAHNIGALFFSDCTQAVGKIPVDVDELGIDLMSFSGHKIYAPKGVGVLYIRQRQKNVKIIPLFHGGGHEKGLRSGTLNVSGIVGLGKACEVASYEMDFNSNEIKRLRNKLENELLLLKGTSLNGDSENRIFNVSNICFHGLDANNMIGRMRNIAVSNGAACSSAVIEPSHVLIEMGLSDDDAFASIRFSLGKFNNETEIDEVIKRVTLEVNQSRKQS